MHEPIISVIYDYNTEKLLYNAHFFLLSAHVLSSDTSVAKTHSHLMFEVIVQ